MADRTCGECKFFHGDGAEGERHGKDGNCYRLPPSVVRGYETNANQESIAAPVNRNRPACGEFKAA